MSSPSTTRTMPSSSSSILETYLLTPPISPLSTPISNPSTPSSTFSTSHINHIHRKRSPSYSPFCPEKSIKLPPIRLSQTPIASRPSYATQLAYTLPPINTPQSQSKIRIQIQIQHRRCVSLPAPAPASGSNPQILFPCRNKSFAITNLLPTPPSSPSPSSSSVNSTSSVSEAMTSRQLPLPTSNPKYQQSAARKPNCTLALLPQSIVNHLMAGGRVAIRGKDGKTSVIRKAGAESVATMQQRHLQQRTQQVVFNI